jgi:DUF4097 and DUF4098 domain-containing protein YvlB
MSTGPQRSFATPGPVSLFVELRSGDLVIETAEVTQTVIDVTGPAADQVLVDQRGGAIAVVGPKGGHGFFGTSARQVTVHVTMPHDSGLTTKLGSTDVRVDGRLGEASVKSGSGDVRIEELAADAVVETGSGDVTVDVVRGPLRVRSGSGDVTLDRVHAPAQVTTGSGDVVVVSADEPVTVKSGSGDARVREARRDVSLTTASGDLVVDLAHRGQLTARNVSGDIRVGVPAGLPVWTDVTTMSGHVRSDLEGAGEPAQGQDFLELRAHTVSGDVHLEQR